MTTYYLFLDTETNARTEMDRFTYRQHIMQLTYTVTDADFNILKTRTWFIADVADRTYPKATVTMKDIQGGETFKCVFAEFMNDVRDVCDNNGLLVAHNLEFDQKVMSYSLECMGMCSSVLNALIAKHGMCTMKTSTDYCKIPKTGYAARYPGYKYPSLCELFQTIRGEQCNQTHYADEDVKLLMECFIAGKQLGLFSAS